MSTGETSRSPGAGPAPGDEPVRGRNGAGSLDITRDSDVPISTQLYWQLAYQVDSGTPPRRVPPPHRPRARRVSCASTRTRSAPSTGASPRPATWSADRAPARASPPGRRSVARPAPSTAWSPSSCARPPAPATPPTRSRRRSTPSRRSGGVPGPGSTCCSSSAPRPTPAAAAEQIGDDVPRASPRPTGRSSTTSSSAWSATTTTSSRRRPSTPTRRSPSSPAAPRSIALMAAPSYAELLEEIGALPPGSTVGMVCSSTRSTANMAEWLATTGGGTHLIEAVAGDDDALARDRPRGRPPAPHPRGAGDRAGPALPASRADPRVDLRPRPGGPRAAPARDRAGAERAGRGGLARASGPAGGGSRRGCGGRRDGGALVAEEDPPQGRDRRACRGRGPPRGARGRRSRASRRSRRRRAAPAPRRRPAGRPRRRPAAGAAPPPGPTSPPIRRSRCESWVDVSRARSYFLTRLALLLEAALDHQARPPRPRSSRGRGSRRR